jgi:transposase-like protein
VRNFSCYLAIGVNTDGERDVLGMWFQAWIHRFGWTFRLVWMKE